MAALCHLDKMTRVVEQKGKHEQILQLKSKCPTFNTANLQ